MIIKLRSAPRGQHVYESVFIGPDADHLHLAGHLAFDLAEWQHFGVTLLMGADKAGALDVSVITEGDDAVVEAFS